MEKNSISLDTLCAALCETMGVSPPEYAAKADTRLTQYCGNVFCGEKADRIFMYNPDAVAQWVSEKYPNLINEVKNISELSLPYSTVMPSVTPVCFGTMYTGAQPEVHGIKTYTKPVLKIETIFDAMIKAGKKCAIVSTSGDSISCIFLEREMDYFLCPNIDEVNAKAAELIVKDEYDLIVVYNGTYDSAMHKFGTESVEALAELRANSRAFATFNAMIKNCWKKHNVLLGFAMDHGCHDIDGGCGSHGLDMPEDINILHMYKAYKGE